MAVYLNKPNNGIAICIGKTEASKWGLGNNLFNNDPEIIK
jgi:hypothetical protein